MDARFTSVRSCPTQRHLGTRIRSDRAIPVALLLAPGLPPGGAVHCWAATILGGACGLPGVDRRGREWQTNGAITPVASTCAASRALLVRPFSPPPAASARRLTCGNLAGGAIRGSAGVANRAQGDWPRASSTPMHSWQSYSATRPSAWPRSLASRNAALSPAAPESYAESHQDGSGRD